MNEFSQQQLQQPPTNKQDFFTAQINPAKPPLLPASVAQKLVIPVSTAIFVALVLTSINPPFVQTRAIYQNKNRTTHKPSGRVSWFLVICVSAVAGLMAWMLPKLSRYVAGTD